MPRRLPPLNASEAFEAAARNENCTRAAVELGVSQVAVSQHVKLLDAPLGLKPFAGEAGGSSSPTPATNTWLSSATR
jgi:DNA-binding transcriptional LysR family regulator